jgi:hypothetical protein
VPVVTTPLAVPDAEGIAAVELLLFKESLIFKVGPAEVPAPHVTVGVTKEVRPVPPFPVPKVPSAFDRLTPTS